MIFNLLLLLFIVLITLYLTTQGLVSALLALITATFSSILAMGLMESLQGIIGGWRPDFARGITFLVLFLVIYGITRVLADIAVPRDVKLSNLANRVGAATLGFFSSLVVMGSLVIGIEMLPLYTSLMGYDRFGGESRMEGDIPGVASNNHNTWLAPERFVLALWNGASGRSLGGKQAWADVHPDIDVESYGYRNTVLYASNHTIPADLMELSGAWSSAEPKDLAPFGIKPPEAGKKIVMVRTSVKRGKDNVDSADPGDPLFRITPTEIRLVTGNQHQYYPIGYLERGTEFTPLPLDTGAIVDDYVRGVAIDDWVFQVPDDETPSFIEVKQLARAPVTDIKDKPLRPLAASDYPVKSYQKEASTITVTINSRSEPIVEGNVYILRPAVAFKDVKAPVQNAYRHMVQVLDAMEAGTGAWSAEGRSGVPPRGSWKGVQDSIGVKVMNMSDDTPLELERALEILMFGPIDSDGSKNAAAESDYVRRTIVPLLTDIPSGRAIIKGAPVDTSGKVELKDIPKGNHLIFATLRTNHAFYYWVQNVTVKPNDSLSFSFSSDRAANPRIEYKP
jgi:hypothetical protein